MDRASEELQKTFAFHDDNLHLLLSSLLSSLLLPTTNSFLCLAMKAQEFLKVSGIDARTSCLSSLCTVNRLTKRCKAAPSFHVSSKKKRVNCVTGACQYMTFVCSNPLNTLLLKDKRPTTTKHTTCNNFLYTHIIIHEIRRRFKYKDKTKTHTKNPCRFDGVNLLRRKQQQKHKSRVDQFVQ